MRVTDDVGYAQLKQIEETTLYPGQLVEMFSTGGVSEIDDISLATSIFSIEDVLRAEENLGREPATFEDLEFSNINFTAFLEGIHNLDTFFYSQRESAREQNGGLSDENTVTDIGRLKVGIQDPDAHNSKKAEERKRMQRLALDAAEQNSREMERLYEQILRLEEEIAQLEQDIEQANLRIEELDEEIRESQALIDDLNSDDPNRSRNARRAIDERARQLGVDISRWTDEDRLRFEQQRIDELNRERDETVTKRNEDETTLRTKEQELEDAERRYRQERDAVGGTDFASDNERNEQVEIAAATYGTAENADSIAIDDLFKDDPDSGIVSNGFEPVEQNDTVASNDTNGFTSEPETSAFASLGSGALDTPSEAGFMSAEDLFASTGDTPIEPTEFETVVQLEETYDTSSAFGSFAGSAAETNNSVLKEQFTAKVAVIDQDATPEPEFVAEFKPDEDNKINYETTGSQTTMSV